MRPNTRKRPQNGLNALALVLASITSTIALWACFGLVLGIVAPYQYESPCGDEGTDTWAECMTNGEPLDLTPIIEDEADTTTSQERNA